MGMVELLLRIFVPSYRDTSSISVRKKYGLLGSFYGLITNFLLFVSKIVIGLMLGLFSIVTDSMNNLSDFGNNFIGIVGVKASAKKADKEHPYGHQRMEYILSLIIACIVIGLSMVMMYQAIKDGVEFVKTIIATGEPPKDEMTYVMYVVSLCVLVFAIVAKLSQAYVYFSLGKRIDSMPLKALGKDARNDVIATLFVIIGLIITWFTSFNIDCFFTFVVAIFVCLSGIGIMRDAISPLVGQEPDHELIEKMMAIILKYDGVLGVHDLLLHSYGKMIYGVIHVEVDGRKDVNSSHEMIDQIERETFEKLGIHLTIHMDPVDLSNPLILAIKQGIPKVLMNLAHQRIPMHDVHIFEEYGRKAVEFELVLPENLDNEDMKNQIRKEVCAFLDELIPSKYELNLGFDSQVQDFLSEFENDAN
jgi:cation diffusion facilitator family transporter